MHNNHYFTKSGKIHRFKETGLWVVEKNQYYSNKTEKCIRCSNPIDFVCDKNMTLIQEKHALVTDMTVGTVLNRIVILPKFHCHGRGNEACQKSVDRCAFNSRFHVETFDKLFDRKYRESVFLSHPKVPNVVKQSVSPKIKITDVFGEEHSKKSMNRSNRFWTKDVKQWLEKGPMSNYSVLDFDSLYFKLHHDDSVWLNAVHHSIVPCNYNQDPRTILKGKYMSK